MTSAARLRELARLREAATPGQTGHDEWHVYVGAGMSKRDVAQAFANPDAAFIAAAYNIDLPALADEVERLEALRTYAQHDPF